MEAELELPVRATQGFVDSGISLNSEDYIANIKLSLKEGYIDPIKAAVVLKRMAKIAEEVNKDEEIKSIILNAFDKHLTGSRKSVEIYNANIVKAATYTFYDFKGCGDDVLDELYKIEKEVKMWIKAHEEELKKFILDEKKQSSAFGVESSAKEMTFENIPKLVWEGYGVVKQVEPPKKIQKMGLKFMKV